MSYLTSIDALIINYAIMQHTRVLDACNLNKYDMMHDDHLLPINSFLPRVGSGETDRELSRSQTG